MAICQMNTVAEIEAAIEKLSPADFAELAMWFEGFEQLINSSAAIFAIYEKEETDLS
jgi:hypothetical protein